MALQQHNLLTETTSSSSSSDLSLSRNFSFSKLNAQAPAFVPTRPQSSSPPGIVIPPPPRVVHVYHPSPPGPVHVPMRVNPHHHQTRQHHHHHNQQQQYVAVRNHNTNNNNNIANSNNRDAVRKLEKEEEEDKREAGAAEQGSKSDKRESVSDDKLLSQVEYYFSDLNLATTDHLMRFINKDFEGYVPISVVASFKKVKAAISNHAQLANILRNSSKLEVSEDGKKVRRLHRITESDVEELQSRIIVAENLPEDHCHQNLMKIFSAVGSVKTIRTCPPQNSGNGTSAASRSAKTDGVHFSNKLHAFVEYESVEIAEKAVAELNDEGNWRHGLRVRLMLKRASKESKSTQIQVKKGHDGQAQSEEDEVSTSEQQQNVKDDSSQEQDVHVHEQSTTVEDHANDQEGAQKKGRNHHRGRGKGRGRGQYQHNNRGSHHHVGTPPPSNNLVNGEQASMAKQPPGPRMPDGTRGFAMGRGKPVGVNVA